MLLLQPLSQNQIKTATLWSYWYSALVTRFEVVKLLVHAATARGYILPRKQFKFRYFLRPFLGQNDAFQGTTDAHMHEYPPPFVPNTLYNTGPNFREDGAHQ